MNGHLPDLYAILQVDRTATRGEIRSAYRRLLRTLHPDLQTAPGAAEAARGHLQAVMEAYDVLGDPQRRADYDRATARAHSEPPEPFLLNWPPRRDGGSARTFPSPEFPFLDVEALLEYLLRRRFPW